MKNTKIYFFITFLVLQIPGMPLYAGSKTCRYAIQNGDCLIKILTDYNLYSSWEKDRHTLKQIAKMNNIKNPDLIYPGTTLILPTQCPEKNITPREPASLLQTSNSTDEFRAHSLISVFGTYNFYRIDSISSSNQTKAILLSSPSLGVGFDWKQIWSENFLTGVSATYQSVRMSPESTGNLLNNSHDLGGTEIYLSYLPSQWFKLKVFGAYEGSLFARSTQVGTATLDEIYQSQLGVTITQTILRRGNLYLNTELGYSEILPISTSSYTIEKANNFIIAPEVLQKLEHMQLGLKVSYQRSVQQSSISKQENKKLGMQFNMSFEIGK